MLGPESGVLPVQQTRSVVTNPRCCDAQRRPDPGEIQLEVIALFHNAEILVRDVDALTRKSRRVVGEARLAC